MNQQPDISAERTQEFQSIFRKMLPQERWDKLTRREIVYLWRAKDGTYYWGREPTDNTLPAHLTPEQAAVALLLQV